ncbi:MAG: hypothetical protein RIR48_386 [Bacteroidota bacterium]
METTQSFTIEKNAFVIEKTIPIPEVLIGQRGIAKKYFWELMEVGDSVFFPNQTDLDHLLGKLRINTYVFAKKKNNDWKFFCKIEEENQGVRVWRVK